MKKKILLLPLAILAFIGVNNYNVHADEKNDAIASGYTVSQFEQIMNIGNFPKETSNTNITMSSDQTKVVKKAQAQIGKPYKWGASGPDAFDCGGLVKYVYKQSVNIDIPMGTTNQEKLGKDVALNALQPGNLLFYGNKGSSYHVGIYIGDNKMIHAPKPGDTVTTVDIKYFYPSFAKRLLSDTPNPPTPTPDIKVGDTVLLKTSATNYQTGEPIPANVKGKKYTVQQIKDASGQKAYLLKEIMSWVWSKDVSK